MNNYNNEEEELELLRRLLEQLQQADGKQPRSISINIFKAGSQKADRVENQYIGAYPQPIPEEREEGEDSNKGELPKTLSTEEAMALWEKAQKAGYVDDNYQPLISRTQSALLADEIAEQLEIKEKWKTFEMLWNRRNMYRDYHDALNQRQSLQFRDKLRKLFR